MIFMVGSLSKSSDLILGDLRFSASWGDQKINLNDGDLDILKNNSFKKGYTADLNIKSLFTKIVARLFSDFNSGSQSIFNNNIFELGSFKDYSLDRYISDLNKKSL
jgi:hypothetical protein